MNALLLCINQLSYFLAFTHNTRTVACKQKTICLVSVFYWFQFGVTVIYKIIRWMGIAQFLMTHMSSTKWTLKRILTNISNTKSRKYSLKCESRCLLSRFRLLVFINTIQMTKKTCMSDEKVLNIKWGFEI